MKKRSIIERDQVVVKFAGDSGDGMQLSGTLFSEASAKAGNDLSTFPDYPAEIRAPQNTVSGVSGFQVHIGNKDVMTSGDYYDVLVAMNPASLKANLKMTRKGATIILNADTFADEKAVAKAGYTVSPLEDSTLDSFNVIRAPIGSMVREVTKDMDLDPKTADRTKNMFALGILLNIFNKPLDSTLEYIGSKFQNKPQIAEANKRVLEAGFIFADNIEAMESTFHVDAAPLRKGKYRNVTGNVATAWGLMAAAERAGLTLFLGSYPITPATDILIELAQYRSLGVKTFQAEDEIAGICSAIGASYAGALGATSTSGPGFSLKSEAIGLAVITELPLVIVNVQRAGPSTGLPTKSEQSDLYQALFGRNGECPCIVMAASSPADCFYSAYEAARLSLEHMTPVVLLTDGYIGNGSQLFRIPQVKDLPAINPPLAKPNDAHYQPYLRNPETLVRQWAAPGTEGLRHRVGGLEKTDGAGSVSTDAMNHQNMVDIRAKKVAKIADFIPEQPVEGNPLSDTLVISWGGTHGAVASAVQSLKKMNIPVAHAHFKYIMPLPRNTEELLSQFKRIIVCELNSGQFVNYLRMTHPGHQYLQFNKVQGQPFLIEELAAHIQSVVK